MNKWRMRTIPYLYIIPIAIIPHDSNDWRYWFCSIAIISFVNIDRISKAWKIKN